MAEDYDPIDDGYEPPPIIPTVSTTAETEQGGTRAAPSPMPTQKPQVPRPGQVTPAAPPKPPAAPAKTQFFTPMRLAIGAVLVGGAAYAVFELTPKRRK